MDFEIKENNGFSYIDEGNGEPLVLLHGLFGALSNWADFTSHFSQKYRVIIPMMPIYTMPLIDAGLGSLARFIEKFVAEMKLEKFTILGNSLGGHVGLIYTLKNAEKVKSLVLTGSSGLFENAMGGSFPKRGDYNYVKERTAYTFYDPKIATKELIDEVFEATTNSSKVRRIIICARSAQRHNMAKEIHKITIPTLLIWGLNDMITPPKVAHEFDNLISNTELRFIDKCGHAPMMERPEAFNKYVDAFLKKNSVKEVIENK